MTNQLQPDLDLILARTEGLWEKLRGQRIFLTGGTGFFGCWLLESLVWANDRLGLGVEAMVLTRNPNAFALKAPHLAGHPAIRLHPGDVRDFAFPAGSFSHVIHAATEASAKLNAENPLLMFDTIVEGTRRVLEFSVQSGARKFLLTSSGAIYGRQPPELAHVPETYSGAPDPASAGSAYGEGKRVAEHLCALYAQHHGIETKIARCFAFVGPYLPLDIHYAIGNFIGDAMRGAPITVNGDGTPRRSYLYASDLAVWLWAILLRGRPGAAYNVGSDQELPISQVASIVAECAKAGPVVIKGKPVPGVPPERYVPDVTRARTELGLTVTVSLEESVRRTLRFHAPPAQERCGGAM